MADGVGGMRAAVLFPVIVLLCQPQATSAQLGFFRTEQTTPPPQGLKQRNISNITGLAPCIHADECEKEEEACLEGYCRYCEKSCCDGLGLLTEAKMACQEFRSWGMPDKLCYNWQQNLAKICRETCSNCTEISRGVTDQCLYFLQSHMDFTAALEYCRTVGEDFLNNGRCESACNTTVDECFSPLGRQCMSKCGNFQTCGCFTWRGTAGEPYECEGQTILKGYIPGEFNEIGEAVKHGCHQMEEVCINHMPGYECGKYKWCEADMCLIKNVTCPITDGCQMFGACETSTGDCYYTLKEEGSICTDGLFYTHEDHCVDGKCTGWLDYCLRDDVKCGTRNPCLKPMGTCHARSGACVFERQPNGMKCSSAPGVDFDGTCQDGLCRKLNTDLCAGKNCTKWLKDMGLFAGCQKEPMCDKYTGECKVEARAEGAQCSDHNPDTYRDMCIEGQCIGDQFPDPMFKKIGNGFCADGNGTILNRYLADTDDAKGCKQQCVADTACVGYSYGFHYCSIYGGVRGKKPSVTWWGMSWLLGILQGDPVGDSNEVAGVTKRTPDQQKVECWQKVDSVPAEVVETPIGHEIAFGFLLTLLTCAPGIWLLLWKLRQHPEDVDENLGGSFHQDEDALDNLREFEALKAQGGLLALHGTKKRPAPGMESPRESNALVAAAPTSNEVAVVEGAAPPSNEVAATGSYGSYDPAVGATGSDGSFFGGADKDQQRVLVENQEPTDPRGEVAGT